MNNKFDLISNRGEGMLGLGSVAGRRIKGLDVALILPGKVGKFCNPAFGGIGKNI
ncbi:MAG: hypothetical protein CM15mP22_5720 [Gammaproteobacteria bacterium]|nr:MAG: hypothetical protein CM15mP22_5720 [Gammaproteobacteria bacterium]